jgi:hypothetical protein
MIGKSENIFYGGPAGGVLLTPPVEYLGEASDGPKGQENIAHALAWVSQ